MSEHWLWGQYMETGRGYGDLPDLTGILLFASRSASCSSPLRYAPKPRISTLSSTLRGLKSFRSSPWDAKEWLPREYSSVFAFENFKRAQKRARAAVERATADLDPCAVAPGVCVGGTCAGAPGQGGRRCVEEHTFHLDPTCHHLNINVIV